MFFDPSHGFVDESNQGSLKTDSFDDVQSRTMLTLRTFVLHKIDAAARMPQAGISTEEQQCRHIGCGFSTRCIQQMIRLAEHLWRISLIVDFIPECFNDAGV